MAAINADRACTCPATQTFFVLVFELVEIANSGMDLTHIAGLDIGDFTATFQQLLTKVWQTVAPGSRQSNASNDDGFRDDLFLSGQ